MTNRPFRPLASIGLAITTSVFAGGCAGSSDKMAEATSGVVTTVVAPPGASSTTPAPTTSAPTTPSTTAPATPPTSRAPSTTRPSPPKMATPNQGDRVFAVFLATGTTVSDPSFAPAHARIEEMGYTFFASGETACSHGAKEALPGLDEMSLQVEFQTRADADRFVALYGRPVLGIAAVNVYCAD